MLTHLKFPTFFLLALFPLLVCATLQAEEKKPSKKKTSPQKITYDDDILPIFRQRCGSCHNGNDQKGGLILDTYAGLMQGGGAGDSIEKGDADSSYLYMVINHDSEPYMPPKQAKMPEKELTLIKNWINNGALENQGSKAVKKKNELAKIEISTTRPADAPVLPQAVSLKPVKVTANPNSVTAIACSPWASLAAVSGFEQVLLYDTKSGLLSGVLPFPEGTPQILKFSRNGRLLLAGGGRGGASGRVIVWDVKTGKRVAELGNDYDAVLAADISSDHSLVVMCGPKRMVRVYSVQTGELMYERKKHTDWVMAAEFSPDGVLLATADRSNGVVLWEAMTGNEYLSLKGHSKAVTDISWRPDSNSVATCSEDGTIRMWELNDGKQIKRWNAHSGGVSSIEFTRDARIVSIGRDRVAKLWKVDGKAIKTYSGLRDVGLEVAFDSELNRVIGGGWTGAIRVWDAVSAKTLFTLSTNPPAINEQLVLLEKRLQATQGNINSLKNKITTINNGIAARKKSFEDAKKKQAEIEAILTKVKLDHVANNKKIQQLAATASTQKKNYDQQVSLLAKANQAIGNANRKIASSDANLKKVSTTKQQADKNVAAINAKVQELTKKGEEAKAELANAMQELAKAKTALTNAMAAVKNATAEKEKAIKSAQQFKAEVTEITKKRNLAKQQYDKTVIDQKNAAGQLKNFAAQIKTHTSGIANQKKQVARRQKAMPVTAAEKKSLATLPAPLKEFEQLLSSLQSHKQKLQKQIAGSAQAASK